MSSVFQHLIDAAKSALQPEFHRLALKAETAINLAFVQLQAQAASGGTISQDAVKDALYKALGNLHLPVFVAEPVTMLIATADLARYEGQGIDKLDAMRKDLAYHLEHAHL